MSAMVQALGRRLSTLLALPLDPESEFPVPPFRRARAGQGAIRVRRARLNGDVSMVAGGAFAAFR